MSVSIPYRGLVGKFMAARPAHFESRPPHVLGMRDSFKVGRVDAQCRRAASVANMVDVVAVGDRPDEILVRPAVRVHLRVARLRARTKRPVPTGRPRRHTRPQPASTRPRLIDMPHESDLGRGYGSSHADHATPSSHAVVSIVPRRPRPRRVSAAGSVRAAVSATVRPRRSSRSAPRRTPARTRANPCHRRRPAAAVIACQIGEPDARSFPSSSTSSHVAGVPSGLIT